MTKVNMKILEDGYALHLSGHATRSSREKFNHCCAGISMLSATAIETATRFMEAEKGKEMNVVNKPGEVHLLLRSTPENIQEVYVMYNMIKAGFDLLIERYPGRIIWGE